MVKIEENSQKNFTFQSALSNIYKSKGVIVETWQQNLNAPRKRKRATPHDEINDKALDILFSSVLWKTGGAMFKEKAKNIASTTNDSYVWPVVAG